MAFDGGRALVVGDYVRIDGALGPWSSLVEAIGIDPLSLGMRLAFLVLGIAWIGASILLAARLDNGRTLTVALACATLWYLPFGTIFSIVQLFMLLRPGRRG